MTCVHAASHMAACASSKRCTASLPPAPPQKKPLMGLTQHSYKGSKHIGVTNKPLDDQLSVHGDRLQRWYVKHGRTSTPAAGGTNVPIKSHKQHKATCFQRKGRMVRKKCQPWQVPRQHDMTSNFQSFTLTLGWITNVWTLSMNPNRRFTRPICCAKHGSSGSNESKLLPGN